MKIYMTEQFHPDAMRRLAELAEVVNTLEHPEEIEGVLVRRVHVTRELIEKLPNLKAIGLT